MGNHREKNIKFLKAYIVNSIVIIIMRLAFCIMEGNAVLDILISTINSLVFASPWYTKGFLFAKIDGIGPLALLMIVFVSLNLKYYIKQILCETDRIKSIILLFISIILSSAFFIITHYFVEINLPFCLIESTIVSLILTLIDEVKTIEISERLFNTISNVLIIIVSIISYIYLFIGYFIDI